MKHASGERSAVVRLLAAAAVLHIAATALMFTVGRARLAPHLVNRDGITIVSVDGVHYRTAAVRLVETFNDNGVSAWLDAAAPVHVRLFSLMFILFGPLFGHSTLAAEPLNLACYLATVSLAYAIARELSGRRVAQLGAALVALWPTYLFHTTQLLKDPLFIAGTLAFVYVLLTWLTMTYDWRRSLASAAAMVSCATLLLLIRPKFVVVVAAAVAFALLLLVARQLVERRLLPWNLGAAVVSLAAAVLMVSQTARTYETYKSYPSLIQGKSKTATRDIRLRRTVTQWRPAAPEPPRWMRGDAAAPLLEAIHRGSIALGSVRARYNLVNRAGGAGIDDKVELRDASDVAAYLPRAAAIGLWAPFPSLWLETGRRAGKSGRLLASVETLTIYILQLLAMTGVLLAPRRLPALFLLVAATFGVTMLGLLVSNVGTIYRFRYAFWIVFIVAGVSGGQKLARLFARDPKRPAAAPRDATRAAALLIALSALTSASCTGNARQTAPEAHRVAIINATGWKISGIYLSPAGAPTWEENLIEDAPLRDDDTVKVVFGRFPPPMLWDLRVDRIGNYGAEWKALPLASISTITLRLSDHAAIADLHEARARGASR